MPDYITPLSRAGGAAGAGGGGLIGGLLGGVGDALSAPRRWIWNVLGLPEEGSELAANVFGLDRESGLAQALGFGAEMLGDPLTYAGGLFGKIGGAMAGRRAGQALEAASQARGPRYAGGFEKIAESGLPGGGQTGSLSGLLEGMQQSPGLARALQEIPEGSRYLGHGQEALALRTPAGDVLRLSPVMDDVGRMARPNIPEVLQPTRAGMSGDIRVERIPFAEPAFRPPSPTGSSLEDRLARMSQREQFLRSPELQGLESSIAGRGWQPVDITSHPGNVGFHQGQMKVIDPGAVLPLQHDPGMLPQWRNPGRLQNWLLDLLGSDEAVRRELAGAF